MDKLKSLNKDAKIICITPLQRADFIYLGGVRNNVSGSYKYKAGQSLAGFAGAIKTISKYQKIEILDLYNEDSLKMSNLVKYKRLKDPQTGAYKKYSYPRLRCHSFQSFNKRISIYFGCN